MVDHVQLLVAAAGSRFQLVDGWIYSDFPARCLGSRYSTPAGTGTVPLRKKSILRFSGEERERGKESVDKVAVWLSPLLASLLCQGI